MRIRDSLGFLGVNVQIRTQRAQLGSSKKRAAFAKQQPFF